MSRRIFIALSISDSLKNEMVRFQQEYRDLPVRWLEPKNFHLTLLPPWYVKEIEAAKVQFLSLKKIFEPMKVDFHSFTFGPNPQQPRLIWLEGKFSEKLFQLKQRLERHYGFQPKKRKFIPHITVARFRPENFASFPVKLLKEQASLKEFFTTLNLFESTLNPSGAQYEVIAKIEK